MAKVILHHTQIGIQVGEVIAAGVAQHMRSGRGGRRHCGEQFGLWRRLLAAALPSILITPGVGLIAAP